jgi:hypothetical protein
MGSTVPYELRFPVGTDVPNVPVRIRDLAEDVNDELSRIDVDVAAVSQVLAAMFPATVQHFDDTGIFTFTNTSFGIGTAGGTYVDCGVAFVAPTSGRVMLFWNAVLDIEAGSNAVAYISPVVRTSATVGAGTAVLEAADNNARRATRSQVGVDTDSSARNRAGASYLLSGLTAGNSYNVRLEHRVTSQTAETFHRAVQVVPAT